MKTVLVTGGTARLGRKIADHLRACGWRVFTSSHRADAGADIVANLSALDGADRLWAAALNLTNGVPPDALVNNAALFDGPPEMLRAVNYFAPKRLIERMAERAQGRGSVVNVLDAHDRPGAYGETKRELRDLTVRAAREWSEVLRVNAVAPGPVLPPEHVHEAAGETPIGRPTPEDVARAIAFLLEATATTGCIIPVDGGQGLFQAGGTRA